MYFTQGQVDNAEIVRRPLTISLKHLRWPLWCSGSYSVFYSVSPTLVLYWRPGSGDSVVVPLDVGRGYLPGPVLNLDAGGGNDNPLLSGDSLYPTPPSQVILVVVLPSTFVVHF